MKAKLSSELPASGLHPVDRLHRAKEGLRLVGITLPSNCDQELSALRVSVGTVLDYDLRPFDTHLTGCMISSIPLQGRSAAFPEV